MRRPRLMLYRPRLPIYRPRLPYSPNLTRSLKGYAYNLTRRYWPTLMAWYEWDDLMQEAMVVFLLCKRKYEGVVDNPAWFMALFKTAWRNRLNTLVNKAPRYSLVDGVESTWYVDPPDGLYAAVEALEKMPLGSRLALIDLTRAQPRLHLRRRQIRELKQLVKSL